MGAFFLVLGMNRTLGLALVILLAGIVFFACSKKTPSFNNTKAFNEAIRIQADDQIRVSGELDAAINDIDSVLGGATSVCGGTVYTAVDSADTALIVTISYSGATCNTLSTRAGTITILSRLGNSWTTASDSVTIGFTNYLVTRTSGTKRIKFNGSLNYKNISGDSLAGLAKGGTSPIVHTISGLNVNIVYDDSSTSRWQFGRQRSYTWNSGLVITTTGLDSANTIGGVADWGANRFGNSIVVVPAADTPWVISQSCGWRTTAGQATLYNPSGVSVLTMGLDTTGKPTGCPASGGTFYYKIAWTGDLESPFTGIFSY